MKNKLLLSAGIVVLLGYIPWAHADCGSLPRSTPEAEVNAKGRGRDHEGLHSGQRAVCLRPEPSETACRLGPIQKGLAGCFRRGARLVEARLAESISGCAS
jgi:hypothetical protein